MIKYGLYRRFEKFSELSLPETFSISKSKKKKKKTLLRNMDVRLCISNR